jgi:hypothetical protein
VRHSRGGDEVNCVRSFDVAVTLCEASDFFGVGRLPNCAFAALTQFSILGNLAGVRIDCVAVEGEVLLEQWAGEWRLWGPCIVEEKRASACSDVVEMLGSRAVSMYCDGTGGLLIAANLLGCTVLAGCAAVDFWLCRRWRRHCLPGAPVLLSNVLAPVGVGSGANWTALRRGMGTLRGVSAIGRSVTIGGSTRGVATLRGGAGGAGAAVSGGAGGGSFGVLVGGRAMEVRIVVSCTNAS